MAPYAEFAEQVDWAPSPDVIRFLAMQTAAVVLPAAPKETPRTVTESPGRGAPQRRPSSARSTPGGASFNGGASQSRGRRSLSKDRVSTTGGFDATLDLSKTLSPGAVWRNEESSPVAYDPGSFARKARAKSADKAASMNREPWNRIHDIPWNPYPFRSNERGLYSKATPKVCSCTRPFEAGANRCTMCGTRRPLQAPDGKPIVVKAINYEPTHTNPHDRSYAWAAVYDQRRQAIEEKKYDEEEEYIEKNGHFNPQLNDRSVAIADGMRRPPIHERVEDIMFKREEYRDFRRQQILDAEVCHECTFTPRLHPKSVGMPGRDVRGLYHWENRRAQKVNARLKHQLKAEAETCPFTPELGTATRRLVGGYNTIDKTVHDRLYDDSRRREIEFKEDQSNLQKLNPKSYLNASIESQKSAQGNKSARELMTEYCEKTHSHHAGWAEISGQKSPGSPFAAKVSPKANQASGGATPRARSAQPRSSMAVLAHQHAEYGKSDTHKSHDRFYSAVAKAKSRGTSTQRKSRSYSVVLAKQIAFEALPVPELKKQNTIKMDASCVGIHQAIFNFSPEEYNRDEAGNLR